MENKARMDGLYNELFSTSLAKSTDLIVERGEGSYLYTIDGEKYLDMVQGIAVNALGHCHPALVEAACQQIKQLGHASFNLVSYPSTLEMAAELKKQTPDDLDVFFFTNSGAEAIETALKLARYVTRRNSIVSFRGGFHGRTMGAASVTSSKASFRKHYAPFLPQIYFAPYPYCFRCPFGRQSDECNLECLAYFKQDFEYIIPVEDVSAVLFEPVQGEGGYIVPPKRYMTSLRHLCDEYSLPLIIDEIQTGMGRTGKMFAVEHFGVNPDIMTLGKAVGGGFPMAVVASRKDFMDKWPPGSHGTTFGGHPLTAATGLVQLKILTQEGFLKEVTAKGEHFRGRLKELKDRFPAIGDVRGLGLMNAIELVDEQGLPDPVLAQRIVKYMFANKVLVLTCGVKGHVLRFMPALNIEDSLLEQVVELLGNALTEA